MSAVTVDTQKFARRPQDGGFAVGPAAGNRAENGRWRAGNRTENSTMRHDSERRIDSPAGAEARRDRTVGLGGVIVAAVAVRPAAMRCLPPAH